MERDWGFGGLWHGLQSRSAIHNPGCAINRNMEHVRYSGTRSWRAMLHGVTALGEPSQHVEKALCSHDAVDYLTQEVGMAVVTGVFFNHMH